MNLINVGLEKYGCKITTCSSVVDPSQQPYNILTPKEDSLWATKQGLPQFVIVSLQDVLISYQHIFEVGFMVWHDYETNPKQIALWVAETTQDEFEYWTEFTLEQKKGIQIWEIKPLPQKYIYLKFSITETYGAFETYLNQIFLMADHSQESELGPVMSLENIKKNQSDRTGKYITKNTQLKLQDLSNNLQSLIQAQRRIDQRRSHSKEKRKSKQKVLNKKIRESKLQSRSSSINSKNLSIYYHEPTQSQYQTSSYQENLQGGTCQEYYQHPTESKCQPVSHSHKELVNNSSDNFRPFSKDMSITEFKKSKSKKNKKIRSQKDVVKKRLYKKIDSKALQAEFYEQPMELKTKYSPSPLESQQQNIYEKQVIAKLDDKFGGMEDSIEALQRKVKVLDLKLSHSHQKLQEKIIKQIEERVQQLVDKKISKARSSRNSADINAKLQMKAQQSQFRKNLIKDFQRTEYDKKLQNKNYKEPVITKRVNAYQERPAQQERQQLRSSNQTLEYQNRLKTSKSFAHFGKKDKIQVANPKKRLVNEANNQQIALLLNKLNQKLKQRQIKLIKMQKKQKQYKARNAEKRMAGCNRGEYLKQYKKTAADDYGVI